MKLLVFCQDALDPRYCLKWKDHMPNTSALKGVNTVADTGIVNTWPIWTTFATGAQRWQHGIRTFCNEQADGKNVMWERKDVSPEVTMVYDDLIEKGCRVGYWALPVTSKPAIDIPGFMVGEGAGCVGTVEPTYLMEYLKIDRGMWNAIFAERMFQYNPSPEEWKAKSTRYMGEAMRYERASTESFVDMCKERSVDVGFLYLDKLDRVGHQCMDQADIMLAMYKQHDSLLGYVQEELCPEDTIVISDHGMEVIARKKVTCEYPPPPKKGMDYTYATGDHAQPGIFLTSDDSIKGQHFHMYRIKDIILEMI